MTNTPNPKIPAHIQALLNNETPPQKPTEQPKSSEILDSEVQGQDLRTLAEARANHAGEKWRKQAEANGEIAKEIGGPKGLEPTRYGDWEKAGRCYDF